MEGLEAGKRARRQAWTIQMALAGLTALALPSVARADCSAPGSIVECTGDTTPNGYGDGTQSNLTIQVDKGASVTGGSPNADAGMELGAGDSIYNFGAINGNKAGVVTSGALGVVNNGTIQSTAGSGIQSGGDLTLTNTATVQGGSASGVAVTGAATITNSGSLLGKTTGVTTSGDLGLTNSGTIIGNTEGLLIGLDPGTGAGTIINSGLIETNAAAGDAILAGDSVDLTNTGQVVGGVAAKNALTVANTKGLINGQSGVALSSAGTADVTNSGTITSGAGVLSAVSTATVANSGTMSATLLGATAISTGTLDLTNSGTITAAAYGTVVSVHGAAKITNSAIISALDNATAITTTGDLTLANTGTVSVGSSTSTKATTYAIWSGGAATIQNSGSILTGGIGPTTGIYSTGVLSLTNSGSISTPGAASNAVAALSDATIVNSGGISATGAKSTAVIVDGVANVTNSGTIAGGIDALALVGSAIVKNTGAITATGTGIEAGSSLALTNSGKIAVTGAGSVAVRAQDSVALQNTGLISGATGVSVTGGALPAGSSIVNNGTIIGTGGTAIALTSAPDSLTLGANSVIGGTIALGGGADTVTIDGSGDRTRVIAFDDLTQASVKVTGTSQYAVTKQDVVIADNSEQRLVDRSLLDVRDSVGNVIDGRMDALHQRRPSDPLAGLWVQGFGGMTRAPAQNGASGLNARHAGALAGYDDNTFANLHVGAFVGGAASSGTASASGDSARGTYGLAGAYIRATPGPVVADVGVVAGLAQDSTNRQLVTNLSVSGFDTAKGRTRGTFVSPSASLGVRVALDDVTTITPSVRVRYLTARWASLDETGSISGVSLAQGGRTMNDLETRAQIAAQHRIRFANGSLMFYETLGGLMDRQNGSGGTLDVLGASLNIVAPTPRVWGAFGLAGFEWRNDAGTSLYASVNGTWRSDRSITVDGKAGAIWRF